MDIIHNDAINIIVCSYFINYEYNVFLIQINSISMLILKLCIFVMKYLNVIAQMQYFFAFV